jgi:hypothetical protein
MQQEKDPRVAATNQSRALLQEINNQYPNNIVTDSYLFSMVNVNGAAVNQITFPLLINEGVAQSIENRLLLSDRFVVRDWSVFLMNTEQAGTSPTAAEVAVGRPSTYPENSVFTAAIAALLESVYNGKLKVTINSAVYYQSFPVRNFFRVPTSQAGVAVSAVAVTGITNRDGWDNLNYPFSPVYPTFTVDGLGNNQIQLTLPTSTVLAAAAGFCNFVCLMLRGYLVQNVNQKG